MSGYSEEAGGNGGNGQGASAVGAGAATAAAAAGQVQAAEEGIPGAIWLTRKEVAERLGITDGKLRGYTEISTAYFGGREIGGKGVRYPLASLETFRQAIRLTPGTFRGMVQSLDSAAPAPNGDASAGESGIAVAMNQSTDSTALVRSVAGTLVEGMAAALREATAPPDKLLTMQEAREEFGLSVGTLRALPHVREGRRVVWSRALCAAKVKEIREAMLNQ